MYMSDGDYGQAFHDGELTGVIYERRAIVAWLRRESERQMVRSVSGIADDIESGVHLTSPQSSDAQEPK